MIAQDYNFKIELDKVNKKIDEYREKEEKRIASKLENERMASISMSMFSDDIVDANSQHMLSGIIMQERLRDAVLSEYIVMVSEFASKSINFLNYICKKNTNQEKLYSNNIYDYFKEYFDTDKKKCAWKMFVELRNNYHHQSGLPDFEKYRETFGDRNILTLVLNELSTVFEEIHKKHGSVKRCVGTEGIPDFT